MKNLTLLFCLITLFLDSKIVAQDTQKLTLNTLAYQGKLVPENTMVPPHFDKHHLVEQNNTNIIQIGDQNHLVSKLINTDQNNLTYIQYGNENNIDIQSVNQSSQQDIYQMGNHNSFMLYNYNSFENQNIQIFQNGSKQRIEVFGENSISKDMMINMEGSGQTLLIRNFN